MMTLTMEEAGSAELLPARSPLSRVVRCDGEKIDA
jgi:hypothetical protein